MRILIFGRPTVALALVAFAEQAKAAGANTVTWADPKHFNSHTSQLRLDVEAVVIDGSHPRASEIAETYLDESKQDATDDTTRSKFYGKRVVVMPCTPTDEDLRNAIALLGLAQEVPVLDGSDEDDEQMDENTPGPVIDTPIAATETVTETPAADVGTKIESLGYPELKALARQHAIAGVKGNTPKADIIAKLHAIGVEFVVHVEG